MARSTLVDIEVVIHHQTELAVLVSSLDGGAEKVWLPLSRIEIDGNTVTLPMSLAEEKGLA